MKPQDEIKKLSEMLTRKGLDEEVKKSVEKRLDILKNNKTVKK